MMVDADIHDTVIANLIDIFALPKAKLLPQHAASDVARWYNALTPAELLAGLRSLGIAIRRHGADALILKDPQQAMTHRLREAVRRRKPELLALLDEELRDRTTAAQDAV